MGSFVVACRVVVFAAEMYENERFRTPPKGMYEK
jgi:hypothetical protein